MNSDWKSIRLRDLGKNYGGLTNKTKEDFGKGKPYIPYMNIFSNGKIDKNYMEYVEVRSGEHQNKVQYGDLFFTTSSETPEEVGMTSVLLDNLEDTYLNSFCFGFRLYNFDDLLPEFASHLFRGLTVRKAIADLAQGSTRYNLSKSILFEKLFLDLPPIPTQREIAKILTTIDNVIEKTEAAIAKYEAIKQGMMHDLFTRGIGADGQLRPSYADAPELYKESALGWIPKEWDCKSIEDVSIFIGSGITPRGGQEVYQSTGVMLIRSQNVYPDGLKLKDVAYISDKINDTMKRSEAYENDVLLNITGASIGRCTYITKGFVRANVNQHVCIIRLKNSSNFGAVFLSEFLNSEMGQQQIMKYNAGGNREGLNYSEIRAMKLPMPNSDNEIEKISEVFSSLNNKIESEKSILSKQAQLKQGLMQDLLTGKVPVKADLINA